MNGLWLLYGVLAAFASAVAAEMYGAEPWFVTLCGGVVVGCLIVSRITRR